MFSIELVCLFVSNISPKRSDGLQWNFTEGVWGGKSLLLCPHFPLSVNNLKHCICFLNKYSMNLVKFSPNPSHKPTCMMGNALWSYLLILLTSKWTALIWGRSVIITSSEDIAQVSHYTRKEWPDVKWPNHSLTISSWTFIWHKLCINTLSCYRDRATVTLRQITISSNWMKHLERVDLLGRGKSFPPCQSSVSIKQVCCSLTICISECRVLVVKDQPQSFRIITCTSIRTCWNYYGAFAHSLIHEDPNCHQN